jgi:hypothetical protein
MAMSETRPLGIPAAIIVPIIYVVGALFLLLGPPGGAGHGWGAQVVFIASFPSSLLAGVLGFQGFLGTILLGTIQYTAVGIGIDLFISLVWYRYRHESDGYAVRKDEAESDFDRMNPNEGCSK